MAGDLAALTQANGRPVPGVAPAAKQMGAHVAATLKARLKGQTTEQTRGQTKPQAAKPFAYADYGNLATIGRMAAVVDLRGLQFSGVLAWWFWLAAHVFFLIVFATASACSSTGAGLTAPTSAARASCWGGTR